jgi:hypothetical protein
MFSDTIVSPLYVGVKEEDCTEFAGGGIVRRIATHDPQRSKPSRTKNLIIE